MDKRTFSAGKLRALREENFFSQAQLAAVTGVHRQTIAAIEQEIRRDPRISTLADLAAGLGVSVDAFLVPVRRTKEG